MLLLNTVVESHRHFDGGTMIVTGITLLLYLALLLLAVSVPVMLYKNYKVNKELLELKRREMDNHSNYKSS